MTLPLWTTTITVARLSDQDTGYPDQEPTPEPVASAIHAHFTLRQTGSELASEEGRSMANSILICDPCGLQQGDRVTNERTGEVWEVEWTIERTYDGGFEYTRAEAIKLTAEMGVMS